MAELGANVLEVSHERLAPTLRVDEVEVVLQVETRGPEHCERVKEGLRGGRLRPVVQLTPPVQLMEEYQFSMGNGTIRSGKIAFIRA